MLLEIIGASAKMALTKWVADLKKLSRLTLIFVLYLNYFLTKRIIVTEVYEKIILLLILNYILILYTYIKKIYICIYNNM